MNARSGLAAVLAFLGVPALIIGLLFAVVVITDDAGGAGCTPVAAGGSTPAAGGAASGTPSEIAGYSGEQLTNAATIIGVAAGRQLPARAQILGVMAAMGESSLVNINYGDNAVNPDGSIADSIGLFQQQSSWGTVEQRMDPATSAGLFYDRLVGVDGWESLPGTIAIHRVQGNADPNHYAKFEDAATQVVAGLSGTTLTPACVAPSGNYPPAKGTPPGPWGGYDNGRIPMSELQMIPWTQGQRIGDFYLRPDALAALEAMNTAYKAQFGYDIPINDGYRDYDAQVQAKLEYGGNAAEPGTSNHGWALAIDIGDQSHYTIEYDSAAYAWFMANGPSYGWVAPEWAREGGPGPHEAWHWEYYGVG